MFTYLPPYCKDQHILFDSAQLRYDKLLCWTKLESFVSSTFRTLNENYKNDCRPFRPPIVLNKRNFCQSQHIYQTIHALILQKNLLNKLIIVFLLRFSISESLGKFLIFGYPPYWIPILIYLTPFGESQHIFSYLTHFRYEKFLVVILTYLTLFSWRPAYFLN